MAGMHSGAMAGVSHPKEPSGSVTILTAETNYWATAPSQKKGLLCCTVEGTVYRGR